MAENASFCDSEDEVFYGTVKEKEYAISTEQGQNYYSPVVNSSTPRANRAKSSALLPDLLKRSACKSLNREVKEQASNSTHNYDDSQDVDYNDKRNDESTAYSLKNDEPLQNNGIIDLTESFDMSQGQSDIELQYKESENCKSSTFLHTSTTDIIEIDSSTNSDFTEQISESKFEKSDLLNSPKSSLDLCDKISCENLQKQEIDNSDRSQSEDATFGTENLLNSESILDCNTKNQNTSIPDIQNNHCQNSPSNEVNVGKLSIIGTEINNIEYESLNAISDSVLNISHGSSLASPAVETGSKVFKGFPTVIYEDISCDSEQLDPTLNTEDNLPVQVADNSVLHMSVDEPFIQSEPSDNLSLYNSCSNTSLGTSYYTAYNTDSRNPSIFHERSEHFNSYRETLEDSGLLDDINKVNDLEITEENKNETSFELVVQNRQNSFSNATINVKQDENIAQQARAKPVSKLPVFSKSATLLKAPKLNIDPSNLNSKNNLWAKQLPKNNANKTNVSFDKQGPSKIGRPNLKTLVPPTNKSPTKSVTLATKTSNLKIKAENPNTSINKSSTKPVTPITQIPNVKIKVEKPKTPGDYKTPAKNLFAPPSRLVKTGSKLPTPRTITPCTSSEKKNLKCSPAAVLQDRDRYKNVMSPIRAYITGSPTMLVKKANPAEETCIAVTKNTLSHLPKKCFQKTPLKTPKALQKLDYGCPPEQENISPNPSRDTLPPKIYTAANAIFVKESAKSIRHLPKLGENTLKLVDTPRPKVIVHRGRVNEIPEGKGELIQTSAQPLDHDAGRFSIRLVKSAEKS